jgi:signal peptidase II
VSGSTRARISRVLALAAVLVWTAGCDQATKHIARRELGGRDAVTLPGSFVEFTLAENPGAFLSVGESLPPAARGAFTFGLGIGLALLLAHLVRSPGLSRPTLLGLALVWAGGTSNLIDRFARQGLVTDFMVVRLGPLHTGVFNFADLAIVAGALLAIASLRAGSPGRKSGQAEPGAGA